MNKAVKIIVSLSAAICIALPLSACGRAAFLESPTGFVLDENYNLTWSSVENARSYILDIKNVETGVDTEATTRRESIALSYLEMGDYDIRVRAVGDKSHFNDSEWSAIVSFNRAYESGCQYKLIKNGSEYEIAAASASTKSVVLEDVYRGKPVTSIGESAFRRANALESIVIGKNVTNIGDFAFYNCVSLKEISIPDTVTSIGAGAFQACRSLTSFKIPAGVKELKDSTFAYCRGLSEIDLNNVTNIGKSVFDNCTGFKTFSFPDQITSIGELSFSGISELKEITIGSGMISIGPQAFSYCTALEIVNFSDQKNLKEIGSEAFMMSGLPSVDIPDGVERIGSGAFSYTGKLESVTIPDSVTQVGSRAFYGSKFYKDAYNAGDMLFYADDWLVGYSSKVDESNQLENLYATNPDALLNTYCIAENTVGIADYTFYGHKTLADVSLSKKVKYVGAYAFYNCAVLYRFTSAGSDLISLGAGAFAYDKELRQVTFLDRASNASSLEEIGSYAFYMCGNFDYSGTEAGSKFIPSSVQRIGIKAFVGTGLYANQSNIIDGVIYADDWVVGSLGEWKLQVMEGGLLKWEKPAQRQDIVTLKENVKGIADYAFYNCRDLTSVGNSDKVLKIGRAAFYRCDSLANFVMNPNLTRIEDYAFYQCLNLIVGRDDLPRNLRSIGRSAFYSCRQIQTIDLTRMPRLESVGAFAFYGCKNLSSIEIGANLKEIDEYTFFGSGLSSVTIPSNVKKIGNSAFSNCLELEEVIFENGVEEIGDFAFRSDTKLKTIRLPDSVKKVGNNAFLQCWAVENIDLGRVENIGDFAFASNFNVKSLVIPDSVKTIGKGAFCYLGVRATDASGIPLDRTRAIVVSGSPEKIDAHAFYGCNATTLFLTNESQPIEWGDGWNSSLRPIVWGVTLSDDQSYVVSVTVAEDTFEYFEELNGLGDPYREGYEFKGWATTQGGTEVVYTAKNLATAPVGTTLYAVYIQK